MRHLLWFSLVPWPIFDMILFLHYSGSVSFSSLPAVLFLAHSPHGWGGHQWIFSPLWQPTTLSCSKPLAGQTVPAPCKTRPPWPAASSLFWIRPLGRRVTLTNSVYCFPSLRLCQDVLAFQPWKECNATEVTPNQGDSYRRLLAKVAHDCYLGQVILPLHSQADICKQEWAWDTVRSQDRSQQLLWQL